MSVDRARKYRGSLVVNPRIVNRCMATGCLSWLQSAAIWGRDTGIWKPHQRTLNFHQLFWKGWVLSRWAKVGRLPQDRQPNESSTSVDQSPLIPVVSENYWRVNLLTYLLTCLIFWGILRWKTWRMGGAELGFDWTRDVGGGVNCLTLANLGRNESFQNEWWWWWWWWQFIGMYRIHFFTGYCIWEDTRYRVPDTGYRIQDTGYYKYRILFCTGYRIQTDTLLLAGYQISGTSLVQFTPSIGAVQYTPSIGAVQYTPSIGAVYFIFFIFFYRAVEQLNDFSLDGVNIKVCKTSKLLKTNFKYSSSIAAVTCMHEWMRAWWQRVLEI